MREKMQESGRRKAKAYTNYLNRRMEPLPVQAM